MAFMVPEYSNEAFVEIENKYGESRIVPAEFADLEEGESETNAWRGTHWFCRLSAPGYMDCTDWSGPFDTLEEAKQDIEVTYDVNPDTGEEAEYDE